MRTALRSSPAFLPCLVSIALACLVSPGLAQHTPSGDRADGTSIPESIREEHGEIHSALVEATKAPGQVGLAARELAGVLHPHFVREEQIALPPLGLLEPLATGKTIPAARVKEILAMTESLRAELPQMLEEHTRIRDAVKKLGAAARAEKSAKAERLAAELAAHARTEEEVLYPAAILVGDVLRMRQETK